MDIEDFKAALKHEMGSVATVFTRKTFSDRIDVAIDRIVTGMKDESAKVMV